MWMHARRAGLAGVLGFAVILAGVGRGEAKEFEIDGTADCGVRSERRCSIDSTLAIWTDDVSGTNQRVEVDVSWIRQALGAIDQDDHVCFVVEDRSDGRLQATGIGQGCDFEGTINPGLSTDEKDVREQPRRKDDDDDHSNAGPNDQQVVAPAPGVPLPVAPPVVAPPVRTVTVFVAANDEAAALVDIVSGQHVTIVAMGTYGN